VRHGSKIRTRTHIVLKSIGGLNALVGIATLHGLSRPYSVTMNSRDASDPADIVEALKTITASQPHHSSPTNPRFVQIRSENKAVELCLERDSAIPTEYWVSTPRKGGAARYRLAIRIWAS
jgi:hypothetical protein